MNSPSSDQPLAEGGSGNPQQPEAATGGEVEGEGGVQKKKKKRSEMGGGRE